MTSASFASSQPATASARRGVSAADPVQSFDLQLQFDPTALNALSVSGGGFLLEPVITFEEVLGVSTVDFAQLSLGAGASGDGVLASITFEALAEGESALTLPSVIVAGPFGVPIALAEIRGARVATTAIPEPGAALLFAVGVLVTRRTARRR